MARTRTWTRVLGYATAGVVVGYLLFEVTGVENEIALLIAIALLAGFVAFDQLRERFRDHPSSTDSEQAGHGSYDNLLLERWKQDLDITATGIRGPSVPSNESTGIGVDVVPIPPIEAGRE